MTAEERPQFERAYTVVLFCLASLALVVLLSHTFLIIPIMKNRASSGSHTVVHMLRFLQAFEAILVLLCSTVGILRIYRSPLAAPTTVALSVLLCLWIPFGTVVFIYWAGWVRRRERRQRQSNSPPDTSVNVADLND